MTEDITPGLLRKIQDDFQKNFDKSAAISSLYKKVRDGTATYSEANDFAIEVGEILASSFKYNLSSEMLPEGRMYYNIAKRIIEPTMTNNYELVTDVTTRVQTLLNKSAGIGIKAIKPELNQDRIQGIINRVSNEMVFDKVAWILDEPVKVFSQSIVDDSIRENAEFQYNAGLSPRIERTTTGNCCEWCRRLADTYSYPDVPKEVYQRHDHCRCKVDYITGKRRENVHHGNTGKRRYVKDEYGGYVKSKEERIAHSKRMEATEKERKEIARKKRIETWEQKRKQTMEEKSAETFKRTFDPVSKDRVVNVMRRDSKQWVDSLSEEEKRCIQKYTLNEGDEKPKFYERLNSMLRGDMPEDDNLRYYAETISAALKRSKVGENIICYRGVDVNPIGSIEVGNFVKLNQFISTSVIEGKSFESEVKIIIYAKKGSQGAYIENVSKIVKQRELLFDKDCIYRVLSNKGNIVELEVV